MVGEHGGILQHQLEYEAAIGVDDPIDDNDTKECEKRNDERPWNTALVEKLQPR